MAARAQVVLCWMLLVALPWAIVGNDEGDALYALRQSLTDPSAVLQSWDKTLDSPCTWFHVTCNADQKVIRVDLGNAALSGTLVPELGILSELQYLEIYSNNIFGSIPVELGNLTNLVSLDLYDNNLTGVIPSSLGLLSNLRFLRLNNNRLTGGIPVMLTELYALQVLDLSYNDLSGVVPVTGAFTRFTPLSFTGNPNLIYPITPSPAPSFDEYHHPQRLMLQDAGGSPSLRIRAADLIFKSLLALISCVLLVPSL